MSRNRPSIDHVIVEKVPAGTHLLVGVSGGIDSIVLLFALSKAARQLKLQLSVAHLNHNLRADSQLDLEFVEQVSANLQVAFHSKSVWHDGVSNIEAWGRTERYKFFNELRFEVGADYVVTAHTANDVAETLLMRLISGKELNSIGEKEEQRALIRPLLGVTRYEIERYAAENKLLHREDPSNRDLKYLRNKIRHELVPYLAGNFEPRILEILSERARETQDDLRALSELAQKVADRAPFEEGSREWRRGICRELETVDPAVAWRIVRALFKPKLGFNLGQGHCRKVLQLIANDIIAVELPGGLRLASREGGLVFE
jgi:tRNA(Ile)-lysidine synthetase-like protein